MLERVEPSSDERTYRNESSKAEAAMFIHKPPIRWYFRCSLVRAWRSVGQSLESKGAL